MSWFTATPVTCPRCAEAFTGNTAASVNIDQVPQARDLVLSGSFHVEVCPACQCPITIERTFMYVDFGRKQFVHVFRKDQRGDWQERELLAGNTYSEAFRGAPPTMDELARTCMVRAVFGMAALAEKLRIWEAGLDDAIVELLKLELLTEMEELADHKDREVLLVSAEQDRRLEFLVRDWDADEDAEVTIFGTDRARYLDLRRQRERLLEYWPGLFLMPYVSYRRLAHEPAQTPDVETPQP